MNEGTGHTRGLDVQYGFEFSAARPSCMQHADSGAIQAETVRWSFA